MGERSEALLPKEPAARARAVQWLIAALNSIEPHVMNFAILDSFYGDQEWAKLRREGAKAFALHRLGSLAKALVDKPYLDGDRFTAGDLMMASVLRIEAELLEPNLIAYRERCTARPAFKAALAAQLGDFAEAAEVRARRPSGRPR